MQMPKIATREQWTAARKRLLAKEKALTREGDALAAERRSLPMVEIIAAYPFKGPRGMKTLRELFGDKRQLVVYHFMFGPDDEGCPACSLVADNFAGIVPHLAALDTAFAVVSRAPIERIEPFRKRMGWTLPWLSSNGTNFNHDFGVTLDGEHDMYNFAPASEQPGGRPSEGEREGLSVFIRDGDRVFHTYSTYQRGLDAILNNYAFMDLTPLGRQEDEKGIMWWVQHRDRY